MTLCWKGFWPTSPNKPPYIPNPNAQFVIASSLESGLDTRMKTPTPTLGFIGTGVMGASMAGHLLRGGYPLHLTTRTQAKAQP